MQARMAARMHSFRTFSHMSPPCPPCQHGACSGVHHATLGATQHAPPASVGPASQRSSPTPLPWSPCTASPSPAGAAYALLRGRAPTPPPPLPTTPVHFGSSPGTQPCRREQLGRRLGGPNRPKFTEPGNQSVRIINYGWRAVLRPCSHSTQTKYAAPLIWAQLSRWLAQKWEIPNRHELQQTWWA